MKCSTRNNLDSCELIPHVKWVHCHHGMAHPRVADGGDSLQIWRVAANMLSKQSRTADSGWSSSLGVGQGLTTLPCNTQYLLRITMHRPEGKRPLGRPRHMWEDGIRIDLRDIGLGGVDWIWLAQDRDRWRAVVSAVMNLRVLAPRR
jgi:hypothetical protein